jgi:hypothetical protein
MGMSKNCKYFGKCIKNKNGSAIASRNTVPYEKEAVAAYFQRRKVTLR